MFTSGSTDADFVWEDDTLRELWANNNTIASHGATSCLRISIQAHQAMVLPCQGTVMRNGEGLPVRLRNGHPQRYRMNALQ